MDRRPEHRGPSDIGTGFRKKGPARAGERVERWVKPVASRSEMVATDPLVRRRAATDFAVAERMDESARDAGLEADPGATRDLAVAGDVERLRRQIQDLVGDSEKSNARCAESRMDRPS